MKIKNGVSSGQQNQPQDKVKTVKLRKAPSLLRLKTVLQTVKMTLYLIRRLFLSTLNAVLKPTNLN